MEAVFWLMVFNFGFFGTMLFFEAADTKDSFKRRSRFIRAWFLLGLAIIGSVLIFTGVV